MKGMLYMADSTSSIYGSVVGTGGIGGLISGLDTKSIVEQLAAASQIKINKQYQAQQKLVYQQDAFRDIISKCVSFSDKYFSFSSKTNMLSSSFFKSSTITSSNDNVKVTGDSDAIKNFTINSITSVATNSSLVSDKTVSNESFDAIFSSESEILKNQLAGQSISISIEEDVDGVTNTSTQTLKISSDFVGDNLNDVVAELNKQINDDNSKLKGKVLYAVNGDKLELQKIDANVKDTKVAAVSKNIEDILKIKASADGNSSESITAIDIDKIVDEVDLKDALLAGEISFSYNGVKKSLTFSEDELSGIDFTDISNITTQTGIKDLLQNKLNNAFGDGKINISSVDGKLSFSTSGTNNTLSVGSISADISALLGLSYGSSNRINSNAAISSSTLNGLTGTIKEDYIVKVNGTEVSFKKDDTIDSIIAKVEADANVNVTYVSDTGKFTITDKTDETKTYVAEDVEGGGNIAFALFNRENKSLDTTKALKDSSLVGLVTEQYSMNVNGADFTFNNNDSISSIISEINKDENAGVTISYSSTTDKFSAISDETGAHTKIEINDASGNNLANCLFGDSSNMTITGGQDTVMNVTINGVTQNITRSGDSFSIDGINLELNKNAAGITEPIDFAVANNTDEVTEKVAQFVEDYNKLIDELDSKLMETPNKEYPPLTDAQKKEMSESEIKAWEEKAREGMLYCNSTVQNVLSSLRDAASSIVGETSTMLDDIGITTPIGDYTGKLVFNEDKFKEKYSKDPDEVAQLFTSDVDKTNGKGIALQLKAVLYENVGFSGEKGYMAEQAGTKSTKTEKDNYLTDRIDEYQEIITKLKESMETEKKRYWAQFSALESALARMNSQSSWLAQQY
ncbi:flagellar filament capping protein FliD [Sedimentibacter sp. zth1]|uniref:flagellar filament capping protein FliD n=1 Tax=Sedimentibacter sp. zth1 TaxID=2816908 RepID=UPI001A936AA2|nr:flagellar filament capping protein FliD [Sedimentibacter sp. zth1]QSX07167.1 flagellar filament capping protein FliD [Sedimentibacter sp. zth1]